MKTLKQVMTKIAADLETELNASDDQQYFNMVISFGEVGESRSQLVRAELKAEADVKWLVVSSTFAKYEDIDMEAMLRRNGTMLEYGSVALWEDGSAVVQAMLPLEDIDETLLGKMVLSLAISADILEEEHGGGDAN